MNREDCALAWVKFHPPIKRPALQTLLVPLERQLIVPATDLPIDQTVICKETYSTAHTIREIIDVNKEE